MAKIGALTDVGTMAQAGPTINNNWDTIVAALENTISRDGSTPNQMEADLDLNENDILNVGTIDVTDLILQGVAFSTLVTAPAAAAASAAAAAASASAASSSASSAAGSLASAQTTLANIPKWRRDWFTATAYVLGDLVQESGNTYICILAHTSGTFSADLGFPKWDLFAAKGAAGAGTGDMVGAQNLNDVANKATARSNLGVPASSVNSVINAQYVFADNPTGAIKLGTDEDIKIQWDNTNSIFLIEAFNTPSAELKFKFPKVEILKNIAGSETMGKFTADGAVELFYDGNKKLETTNTGVGITGNLTTSGVGTVTTLAPIPSGVKFYSFDHTATDAPGTGPYSAVGWEYGNGTLGFQAAFVPAQARIFCRTYNAAWNAWAEVADTVNHQFDFLQTGLAAINSSALGTDAFLSTSSGDIAQGSTVAGSNLRACGIRANGAGTISALIFSGTQPGTWMALGRAPGQPGVWEGATVFRRVA